VIPLTAAPAAENLRQSYEAAVLALAGKDPGIHLLEVQPSALGAPTPFRGKYPQRYSEVVAGAPSALATAAELAENGRTVFASVPLGLLSAGPYELLRDSICFPHRNVKVVATDAGLREGDEGGPHAFLEDLGIARGLPGLTVVVPADGPTTRAAVDALCEQAGPAYLRLSRTDLPTLTDGSFRIGRAKEVRGGSDVALVAVGAMLGPALDVAEDLGKVGVSARVLDFASMKPFDEPALLRAARDTGAILTLEEHSVLTGLGALVASTVAENYPVPVRRVGVADVFVSSARGGTLFERYGLGRERIRDEAWELLGLRGRVS
jgi:transketolase